MIERGLQIGSLGFHLRASRSEDIDAIALLFKQSLDAPAGITASTRAGEVVIVDDEDRTRAAGQPDVPADGLLVQQADDCTTVRSELMTMTMEGDASWRCIRIAVHRRVADPLVQRVHLSIMLHRALQAFGAVHLHAGAVTFQDTTFVFVGEKGAGKSTIAARLGRDGATILSDDHVLLRTASRGYVVSGCETRARVAADTEAAVFAAPIVADPADYAGTMKKEFAVADVFRSQPYVEMPVGALFFPRVGDRLRVTPRSARAAALECVGRTRHAYRPQDADEIRALLDFWLGLAQSAPAFDLELSPDLGELQRLADVLDACLVLC
jgi:hypothetical protein